jgi:MFS family permease
MSFIQKHFPALAHRDFAIFWAGQFVSLIGTWMQSTTQPYLAYRITGSSLDLGLIGFASTLPTLFLALPGGVIVERLDKRKTVIALQSVMMIQAFTLAYLALSGLIQVWHIVVLAFILGIANAIEITARQAMLIELVGKKDLPNAIALQATIFNAARVLGPSLVAPFVIFLQDKGEGWAFFANGVSFLFVIIGLFFVRSQYAEELSKKEEQNFWREFKEGQKYILQTPAVGLLILLASILGFFGFPMMQQIPAIARNVLAQIGDTDAIIATRNSMMYMFMGVGALIAALILSLRNPQRKGLLVTLGQAAFVSGLIAISFTRSVPAAMIIITVMGWGMVTQLATMNTLIQIDVPNEYRGRVFSTYLWALQGVAPFGSLLIGAIAQSQGVPFAALFCGAICLIAIVTIHARNPQIRSRVA